MLSTGSVKMEDWGESVSYSGTPTHRYVATGPLSTYSIDAWSTGQMPRLNVSPRFGSGVVNGDGPVHPQ